MAGYRTNPRGEASGGWCLNVGVRQCMAGYRASPRGDPHPWGGQGAGHVNAHQHDQEADEDEHGKGEQNDIEPVRL